MTTIKQDLETVREDLMKAHGRLGKYRKLDGMAQHARVIKLIRNHIYEAVETLQEFTEENFK